MLCFVGASWPILTRPRAFSGVRLESERTITKLLVDPVLLDPTDIQRMATFLMEALPSR